MNKLRVGLKGILLQLLSLAVIPFAASSPPSGNVRNIFTQAETFYLYEEYDLANQLYLLLDTPDNLNVKYKIGNCYLNIAGEKDKAVGFLEAAVKNTSYDARTDFYKEKRAPLDAWFSLARAYMINNQLEKGLATLETFKKLALEVKDKGGMRNIGFIDQQILACRNAINMKNTPVSFTKKTLGAGFNQGAINENAAVSFDGNTIVYTERRGMVNAIFWSRKEKGIWLQPSDITGQLQAGDDCSSCSLNSDGTELFLYKTDNYDGVIYSSVYSHGSWNPVKKLNKNINTKYYESHASISPDGKRLYFTSNREGGYGNLDIYVSEKEGTGDWGPAINMGPAINTPFNDDTPFITDNDSALYFSSEGHTSMGGFDIFKSSRNGNGWDDPVNIGYPINTPDNERFYQPWNSERNAYYTMTTDYKKREIFFLTMGDAGSSRFTEINGKITLSDTIMAFDKSFRIHLVDQAKGDTIDVGYPNKFTGIYSFFVLPGKYRLIYTGAGYYTQTIDTTITKDLNKLEFNIDMMLRRNPLASRTVPGQEKMDFTEIPMASEMDSTLIITNLNVNDLNDKGVQDSEILYYTVQVMALYKPVDLSYFKFIPDIRVMYNQNDKFYRYTTGIFQTREEAVALKLELLRKGYPDDIFVKKVSRQADY